MDPASDPRLQRLGGGARARLCLSGNKKVGESRMEITDTKAPQRIAIKLDFQALRGP